MFGEKSKQLNEFDYVVRKSDSLAKGYFSFISKSKRDMTQEKTSITKPIQKRLKDMYLLGRYGDSLEFNFLNKYEDINYEGKIIIENQSTAHAFIALFELLFDYPGFKQFNKYRNYSIDSISKGMITFKYFDSLGNNKTRIESVLVFKKYILDNPTLKHFISMNRNYLDDIITGSEVEFTYKITNNINDKLKVVKMNEQRGSCQGKTHRIQPGNYARGLYDFFNNGCIAPLIVYHEGKIVGRAAFRIFFDEDGKRYINLERMFGHGHLINNLSEFCKKLTEDLLKLNETLTISEQFSVTNTYKRNPWFEAIGNSKTMKMTRLKTILRQPKRLVNGKIGQGYYQDSLIHTMCVANQDVNKQYIYDCVNPSDEYALHIITLKDVSSKKA